MQKLKVIFSNDYSFNLFLLHRLILQKHTYTHTGLMPFICGICPKKYATKHKLKEHMMRHEGIKNHICPFCGLRKTTPHELKVHINYHTREKMYPCKVCSAVFSSIGKFILNLKLN